MTKLEIQEHLSKKKKFNDYPQLPKYIRTGKKANKGLQESCTRGFLGRVRRWEIAQAKRELTEERFVSITESVTEHTVLDTEDTVAEM